MDSLKKELRRKLSSTEHLKTKYETLPCDTLLASKILDDWEHEWVKAEFEKQYYNEANERPKRTSEIGPPVLETSGQRESEDLHNLLREKAMKELSMKRYLALLGVTAMNQDGLSTIDIIRNILYRNCKSFTTAGPSTYFITFQGYQSFIQELTDYLISNNSSNCLWIVNWFSTKLYMKLSEAGTGAYVPLSVLLSYIDKKLGFYYYWVQQLELGSTMAMPVTSSSKENKECISIITEFR